MKNNYPGALVGAFYPETPSHTVVHVIGFFLILLLSVSYGYGQGGKKDPIIIRICKQDLGNGLYKADFSYENTSKKELDIAPGNSKIKLKNRNKEFNGPNKFKPGVHKKVYSLTFNSKESVSWTITTPSGNVHEVIASANSSKCTEDDTDIISNVIGGSYDKNIERVQSYALAWATDNAGDQPLDFIYQTEGDRLLVQIIPESGQMAAVIQRLESELSLSYASGDFIVDPQIVLSREFGAIDAYLTKAGVLAVNEWENVNFVRALQQPIVGGQEQGAGLVNAESDAAHRANLVRKYFGTFVDGEARFVDGSGVGVAIFSNSFDREPYTGDLSKFAVSVINCELPGLGNLCDRLQVVRILKEGPFGGFDEGRAMAEIIHDIAPGANLAFRTAAYSEIDFALGIESLPDDIKVAVDDVTYVTESFDGDNSVIVDAIGNFLSREDREYIVAAGNFFGKGFQGIFNPGSGTPNFEIPLNPNVRAHVFSTNPDGSENYRLPFTVEPGIYTVVIQQDEPFASYDNTTGAYSDFDLVITDENNNVQAVIRDENDGRDPVEIFVFRALEAGEAYMSVLVEEGANFAGTPFRAIAFRAGGLEFSSPDIPTISGHAAFEPAITVGAIDQANAENPVAQSFSSYGGLTSNNKIIVPDIAGYDGVSTSVTGYDKFFGTSAAAPAIAGLIALLDPFLEVVNAEASSATGGAQAVTSSPILDAPDALELYQQFSRGTDNGNNQLGSGAPDALNAFDFIASRAPIATLEQEGIPETPGSEEFTAVIVGENLAGARILLGEDLLELEILENTENRIVFTVPEFVGEGTLRVETPKKSTSGNELTVVELNLLPDGVRVINITAGSLQGSFGDAFTFTYEVEGLPEGMTYEETGLPEIEFASAALELLPYPDANSYLVLPQFVTDPTEEQAAAYRVNFIGGELELVNRDLLIRPKETTITYGDEIAFEIEYIYDPTGIEDNSLFLNTIKEAHQSGYYPETSFALINGFRTAFNQQQIIEILENNAWMASENTFLNGFRTAFNGVNIIDLEQENFEDFSNATELNGFRTAFNNFRTIFNGQDFLNGLVEVSFENNFRTIFNESDITGEGDQGDYSNGLSIMHETDIDAPEGDVGIDKFYALNLLSGIGVTITDDDRHFIAAGEFLSPLAFNFNKSFDLSRLTVLPATLMVSTADLRLEDGAIFDGSLVDYTISGYVYGETEADVFPEGVQFTLTSESGQPYAEGDAGCFLINIQAPENYSIENSAPGKLYINPAKGKKIRVFFNCVQLNTGTDSDTYPFIANFRYENDNDFSLFLFDENNSLEGDGNFVNTLPDEFLPGEHFVQIPFDGERLTWTLCTFGSCNPTSVTTDATLESNRCTAQDIEAIEAMLITDGVKLSASSKEEIVNQGGDPLTSITVFPNPVEEELTIHPGPGALRSVALYDITGKMIYEENTPEIGTSVYHHIKVDFPAGLYLLKVTTTLDEKVIKVMKN